MALTKKQAQQVAEAARALERMEPILERIATALEIQTMAYVKQVESASAARAPSGVGRRGRSA